MVDTRSNYSAVPSSVAAKFFGKDTERSEAVPSEVNAEFWGKDTPKGQTKPAATRAAADEDTRSARRMTRMNRQADATVKSCGQGMSYTGPVIITHKPEKNGNNCVITNDSHTTATNNGFKRGDSGRFFCH